MEYLQKSRYFFFLRVTTVERFIKIAIYEAILSFVEIAHHLKVQNILQPLHHANLFTLQSTASINLHNIYIQVATYRQ